jgi:hypothetical protein
MARVRLHSAMVVGQFRYKAGTTMADSVANAVGGDVVWTGLTAATWHPGMLPLDGAANTMKAASQYSSAPAPGAPTGRDSIDA